MRAHSSRNSWRSINWRSLSVSVALFALGASPACNPWGEDLPEIGPRQQNSPALQAFDSCDDLQDRLRRSLKEEMRVQLLQSQDSWRYGPMAEDSMTGEAAPGSDGASNGGERTEGVDFSGTNNQEEGVDEADFVKTDGYYIYTLNGNRLEILSVPEFGELSYVGATEFEGFPTQMLIDDDKVVVFSQIYTWDLPEGHPLRELVGEPENDYGWWYWSEALSKITVVDVSDRAHPSIMRELYLEGYYQTARKVDSTVRMVSYAWMNIPGLRYYPELPQEYYELNYDDPRREALFRSAVITTIRNNDAVIDQATLEDFVPQIFERFASGLIAEHSFTDNQCRDFTMAQDGMSRGVNSILSLDLLGPQFAYDADHIIANSSVVYASTDTLVLAERSFDWWWYWNNSDFQESTNIHRFDISQPGQTRYTGSGRVEGFANNQFNLSESNGYIRVATSTGAWWWWDNSEQEIGNNVYVLAGDNSLETLGSVTGIAPGERLWATRFVGDKAYLVTFRNVDPLWTLDLSNPRAPRVIGELEVPGVSTYIHPMDDSHLLTIGYGGDENGMNWATQVSLFDVGDFAHPSLDAALSLKPDVEGDGWTYAWSEATWEHKAFQYWGPMNMLAIPLSTYRSNYDEDGYWGYEYKSQLALIQINGNAHTGASPLQRYDAGQIDHSDFFNRDSDYYWDWRDVRRSIFMGDYIYAISDRGVTVHRLADLQLTASVELEGNRYNPYWGY